MKYKNKTAFTLVEMSLVLITISFITASILGGSIYIRQAEIKSFSSEILDIKKAVDEYANMYGSYAGDTSNASDIFSCSGCDGDGDNELSGTELQLFWQHLSLSEFIEGKYDGSSVIGQGIPISKTDTSAIFKIKELNDRIVLVLQGISSAKTALSPKEIEQIDAKYDDGNPYTGNIIVEAGASFSESDCIAGDEYNISNTKKECNLLYVLIGDEFVGYHWETDIWGSCNGISNWVEGAFGACSKNCPNDGVAREGCCTDLADPNCLGACGAGYQNRDVSCDKNDGSQTRNVYCADEEGNTVASSFCSSANEPDTSRTCTNDCDIDTKPETKEECLIGGGTCDWYVGDWTCDASPAWNEGAWGVCSGVCGSGEMTETRAVTCPEAVGTKTRTVYCPYASCNGAEPVSADSCTSTEFSIPCTPPQPDTTRPCSAGCEWSVGAWSDCLPQPDWNLGLWSSCSEVPPSCVVGIENRTVSCTDQAGTMTRAVNCITPPCYSAAPASSEECTATCATPVPAYTRTCNNNLTLLTIENSISTVAIHTQTGNDWVGCLNTN